MGETKLGPVIVSLNGFFHYNLNLGLLEGGFFFLLQPITVSYCVQLVTLEKISNVYSKVTKGNFRSYRLD